MSNKCLACSKRRQKVHIALLPDKIKQVSNGMKGAHKGK